MNAPPPRLVAWELTRRCNLHCGHCRANAESGAFADELSLDEGKRLLDEISSMCRPILILTGGEPLLCPWLFDIVAHARGKGMKPVLGTNGTLVDARTASRLAEAGVRRISVSIDFPDAARHDGFRGEKGAFDAAVRGIREARAAGIEVQINSTVTAMNRTLLPELHDLAASLGAVAFHPFLFVPTGRGHGLAGAELSPGECEEALTQICSLDESSSIEFKPTDAPQYKRILRQCGKDPGRGRGCLAGTGFSFIGSRGDVKPCGYFDLSLGNVREKPFGEIWRASAVLDDLRHPERLKGKCGECEYREDCGGCRARALAATGDYLSEEPCCVHVPEKRILAALQTEFPVAARPYAVLGERLGIGEEELFRRVASLKRDGKIRRIGASFDSRRLGYVSTLVGADVEPGRIDEVADAIAKSPAVTHNYLRDGSPNMWFTVVAPGRDGIKRLLAEFSSLPGVESFREFPARKTFKINSVFGTEVACGNAPGEGEPRFFSAEDRVLVGKLQGDISGLGLSPFAPDEMPAIKAWVRDGTVRRLGAFVDHRRAGAVVNVLAAWTIPEESLDCAGRAVAAFPFVSHCLSRACPPGWTHNLFAMVHSGSDEAMSSFLATLLDACEKAAGGRVAHETFPTVRELKKSPMRYFREDVEK